MRPSRVPIAILVALAMTLTVAVTAGCTGTPAAAPSVVQVFTPDQRQPAPALSGELLDGTTFNAADHAGDVVVVNFWGSWCPPCRVEADDLEQTYTATKDEGVTFVGINVRDTRDGAKGFVANFSHTYPSIFDPESRLALGFAISPAAIPSTIIIDRQGRVAMITQSAVLREDLEPLVQQIAEEPA